VFDCDRDHSTLKSKTLDLSSKEFSILLARSAVVLYKSSVLVVLIN